MSSRTAVQLRQSTDIVCRLVHGNPVRTAQGQDGAVALFDPGSLVAYAVDLPRRSRLFLFRTTSEPGASTIPGVFPAVDLLLATRTHGQTARMRNLFLWLSKHNREPESLSDAFWARVAGVVAGRIRSPGRILPDLLAREAA